MVDGITVFKIEATVYDEETEQLLDITIGPTHDRDSLRRVKSSFEDGLREDQEVIEYRRDTITRGTTERSDKYYKDERVEKTED